MEIDAEPPIKSKWDKAKLQPFLNDVTCFELTEHKQNHPII